MTYGDRFAISAVLGVGMVAFYEIPAEMLSRLMVVPAAIIGALFPILVRDLEVKERDAAGLLF